MNNDTAKELMSEVQKASVIIERQWPGVVSAEDAEQEIWVRLLESDGSVEQLLTMNMTGRKNSLVAIGHQIASQYRASYDLFTGQIFYSVNDVKALLERGALDEERSRTDTERMDLEEASQMLRDSNPRYSELIWARYMDGQVPEKRFALSRAVEALTGCMNQVHRRRSSQYETGPGSRKVRSNAAAQAASKSFYEEWDGRNGIQ